MSATLHRSHATRMDGVVAELLDDDAKPRYGAISMPVPELSGYMGGTGRAKLIWDCYKIGVDPQHLFGCDNGTSGINLCQDEIEAAVKLLPSGRRSQKLGREALQTLANSYLYADKIEDGVARLSHVSTSSDSTTKMLLKLHDGLEVETVIIPVDGRSTLCVSSQVGCRQGKKTKHQGMSDERRLGETRRCLAEVSPPTNSSS